VREILGCGTGGWDQSVLGKVRVRTVECQRCSVGPTEKTKGLRFSGQGKRLRNERLNRFLEGKKRPKLQKPGTSRQPGAKAPQQYGKDSFKRHRTSGAELQKCFVGQDRIGQALISRKTAIGGGHQKGGGRQEPRGNGTVNPEKKNWLLNWGVWGTLQDARPGTEKEFQRRRQDSLGEEMEINTQGDRNRTHSSSTRRKRNKNFPAN